MLIISDGAPRGLGYLEVDQRNVHAPLPPGVARHYECDTYTCRHCETVVAMNPLRVRERYKCKGCNHHVCDPCAAELAVGAPCKTYEQHIDELRERALRQPDQPSILLP